MAENPIVQAFIDAGFKLNTALDRAAIEDAAFVKLAGYLKVNTWTPTDDSGAALVLAQAVGRYFRIGSLFVTWFSVQYPVTADATSLVIGGLPATSKDPGVQMYPVILGYSDINLAMRGLVDRGSTQMILYKLDATRIKNSDASGSLLRGVAIYEGAAGQ